MLSPAHSIGLGRFGIPDYFALPTVSFSVISTDPTTSARQGRLVLPHGVVETPIFMPVGTQGSVKTLHPQELDLLGSQIILGNTYHLWLRPGHELIREMGGLHGFTTWQKPFLTTAPYVIVVFRQSYGIGEGGKTHKNYYSPESVGIAVGFLIAALNRFGLSTLTHTPSPMAFLNEICGRPSNEKAFVVLPVGYPADGCTVPDIARLPESETIHWK